MLPRVVLGCLSIIEIPRLGSNGILYKKDDGNNSGIMFQ
jgi:hypothetical protein